MDIYWLEFRRALWERTDCDVLYMAHEDWSSLYGHGMAWQQVDFGTGSALCSNMRPFYNSRMVLHICGHWILKVVAVYRVWFRAWSNGRRTIVF